MRARLCVVWSNANPCFRLHTRARKSKRVCWPTAILSCAPCGGSWRTCFACSTLSGTSFRIFNRNIGTNARSSRRRTTRTTLWSWVCRYALGCVVRGTHSLELTPQPTHNLLATHRRHITSAYASLGLKLDVKLHLGRRLLAQLLASSKIGMVNLCRFVGWRVGQSIDHYLDNLSPEALVWLDCRVLLPRVECERELIPSNTHPAGCCRVRG